MRLAAAVALCVLVTGPATALRAQAAAEYGLSAGRAAGMAGPASGIGKKISGIAGGLEKTLQSLPTSTPSKPMMVGPQLPAPKVPLRKAASPARVYEDLKNLEVGMQYSNVVRRFGPPAMEFQSSAGKSLTYTSKIGMTQVEVRNGAVASISMPGASALVLK